MTELWSLGLLFFSPSESYFSLQQSFCRAGRSWPVSLCNCWGKRWFRLCFESLSEEPVPFYWLVRPRNPQTVCWKSALWLSSFPFPNRQLPKLRKCLKTRWLNKFSSCLQAPLLQMRLFQTSVLHEGPRIDFSAEEKTQQYSSVVESRIGAWMRFLTLYFLHAGAGVCIEVLLGRICE